MAGRGRGRAVFTFNIEAIGFAKGAALPDSVSEAPPLYPSTENKPVPLKAGEDEDYMLAVKQEFRGTLKTMPYFLTVEHHEVIERYRKKYQDSEKKDASWSPAGTKPKKAKISKPKSNLDVLKKIEELEEKDNEDKKSEDEKEETKDKEDEDDEKGEESEEDDEEHEEENDYIASYFEDGDDFDAASDDNMDEATY
ncbi:DNA-directed RNA polymerase III subunit RPC7 isoform X3 [Tyto alba]|uniref:DNA-directed RNA polymerase III subunit RPC7 isoform X3 n=1 Tax=Tyto alba TaxID=56313 RepID=UPI001403E5EB|nr:DNA-directed RNA polymerase III subunit RPC7 isoform X3 [Tyto alba]